MLNPITALTGNLIFTARGSVWAMWRLDGLPYGMRPADGKRGVRAVHTALFRSLPGESLLLGLHATTDPASIVEAMIEGVDIDDRPDWALEAEANLDRLETIELGRRTFFLAAPLANPGFSVLTEIWHSALAETKRILNIPGIGPSTERIEARLTQADKICQRLPNALRPRPATVAEILWVHQHAIHRGLGAETVIPTTTTGDIETEHFHATSTSAVLPAPVLDEGGHSDLPSKRPFNPFTRRFLKVTDPDSGRSSYQVNLTIAGTPAGGLTFPGGEWLGTIDDCGVKVDWAIRLNVRSRQQVTQANLKALRQLNDQVEQRAGTAEVDQTLGGLAPAAAELREYTDLMAQDELEVEVESTTILTVAGPTAEEATDKAAAVSKHMGRGGWEFKVTAEVGAQEELWLAGLPGNPSSPAVRQLAQITTARSFAVAVPLITSQLGDDRGIMWYLETGGATPTPGLIDIVGATTDLNTAIAVGCVGELGAGKSVALKSLALGLIDRGAQGIAIDKSDRGEWAIAFDAIPGSRVVEISEDAQVSLDPLRVFPTAVGAEVAMSFLTTLLHVKPSSREGVILGKILDADYLVRHGLTSMGDVVEHLATLEEARAAELADLVTMFSRKSWARVIFDKNLPAMSLDDPALVIRTHRLKLPSANELTTAHLFDELPLEKIFGRACYTLAVAVARRICFRTNTRLGFLVVDEAASMTISPEAEQDTELWIRQGRQHLAGLLLGSHDPAADFGNEVLRNLIPVRLLMRHRSKDLARRGLEWLGLDPDDPALLHMVMSDLSPIPEEGKPDPSRLGEGIMRDFRNRFGLVQILPPARLDRQERVFSSPPGQEVSTR